ncbi:glycine cleavage system protein GcvH [Leadbetterella byssophila]|jgi:glycine cleavage system H protein|uniref:Glycine cleavage system H protein n=1 Tax=Leadbetterella byssophila (strain DSM 17132 / JCM 16389 / KACC 11308 / NBRC 106382 / 4M15) TaxID=649349 RepID=E4RWQ1_LEAB4|nr:glycine cleavage system protein GcvH [Leadbetterella byssophila]ADQ16220.1 glycine cleavage system H protein [Leadbetterella byssophila DSM 17132]
MNFPEGIKYTQEHEWIRLEGDVATVGITDFAQSELGDIVFVEVETVGESLGENEVFGTVEAVKTVSDLYLPISGEVLEVNEKLSDEPELINNDPYGDGWIIKLKVDNVADVEKLMDAETYKSSVGH